MERLILIKNRVIALTEEYIHKIAVSAGKIAAAAVKAANRAASAVLQRIRRAASFLLSNKSRAAALTAATAIIALMLVPNISRCIANGSKYRHLSTLYKIDHSLSYVLEQELKTEYHTWHALLEEHNSEKLLNTLSTTFFKGKLNAEDYYTESDGNIVSISSAKYPDMQTLKIKIPEAIEDKEQ